MTTEPSTEVRAAFLLLGEGVVPDTISQRLSLVPTKTWRRGAPRIRGSRLRHATDGWAIETQPERALDMGAHVRRLLETVHPLAGPIRDLCGELRLTAEIECIARVAGHGAPEPPILFFDEDAVVRIADLGASVDVDINFVAAL
ncbi:MAG: DUF4279 domain-containing protein [Acidimicrobiia bacterium]|nr:DUF4279 domain-containing protein [Acidimicrobiia bacterium]